MNVRLFLPAMAGLVLSACAGVVPRSATTPPPPAKPQTLAGNKQPPATKLVAGTPVAPAIVDSVTSGPNALSAGIVPAPVFDRLPYDRAAAARALTAFRLTCPALAKRADQSGLTRPDDWKPACDAASRWPSDEATGFFQSQFDLVQVGDGKALATGYYEPEIAGSRTRQPGFDVPVYRRPPELVEIDLGQFSETLKGRKLRGKVSGNSFIPFADRAEIESGNLAGRGLEIAWAADPVEFFFLQVQGSGRLRQPDGSVVGIGFDGHNGRDYTGIGKLMKDRGLLGPGQSSMQGIMERLRANPEQGKAIMRENRSWVFFRELTGAGPLGALGYQVMGRVSVAADPAFVPLGAPVLLSMDRADASGLWVAQDTGGAIKGSNRFDTFWGAGDDARATAGGMQARGTAFVFLPKSAVARINGTPRP